MNFGRIARIALVAPLLLGLSACQGATSNPVSDSATMPFEASIGYPPATRDMVYPLPPQSGGPTSPYTVPVGELLQGYAEDYIPVSFTGGPQIQVAIGVDDFQVREYQANVTLTFAVSRDGNGLFEKSYTARGRRHPPQGDWGGTFETRQAVNLTIDEAMRSIFTQFLADARKQSRGW